MLRVLFDHQIFSTQNCGGISLYFSKLFEYLMTNENININTSIKYSDNINFHNISNGKIPGFFIGKNLKGKFWVIENINRIFSKNKIKKDEFDLFHPTYYHPYFLKYLNGKPFVLTIFDMIHEQFKVDNDSKVLERKQILAERASKIITISENSKKDIIKLLRVPAAKIEVIHLAGDHILPVENQKKQFELPSKYILFIGKRRGYKNFNRLTDSVSKLLKRDKELYLVCAGGGLFSKDEKDLFKDNGILGQILHVEINNNLFSLYNHAELFVYPSLYEGFGIPVLESFISKCPAAISNKGSLPEVGGDAVQYFDPYSVKSIEESINMILFNPELKERLRVRGFHRGRSFSWEKTCNKTLKVYKSVVRI